MPKIVTYRTGAAKNEYVNTLTGGLIEKTDGQIYVIVPEQSSFERDRQLLLALGAPAMNRISVSGFSRLAGTALEKAGVVTKPKTDESGRAVIMSLAVSSLADRLSIFSGHHKRKQLVADLLGTSDELTRAALTPEELTEASEKLPDGRLRQKAGEIALISSVYRSMLTERFSQSSDTITVYTDFLKKNYIYSTDTFIIDDFRGFTRQELLCLAEIIKQCSNIFVFMPAEKDFMTCRETDVFAHSSRALVDIAELAKKAGREFDISVLPEVPCRYADEALSHLEKNIYSRTAEPFCGDASAVTLASCDNRYAECELMAQTVKKLITSGGYRCRDIMILERNTGDYLPTARAALKKYGVPVFEDNRRQFAEEPPVRLCSAALEAVSGNFGTPAVLRYLKTGLSPLTPEECSDIENYVLLWQINYSGWTHEWRANPAGFGTELTDSLAGELARLNEIRERAIKPLMRLKKELSEADGKRSAGALYGFIESTDVRSRLREYASSLAEAGDEQGAVALDRVWDMLMSALDSLAGAIGDRKVGALQFYELFSILVSASEVGEIPQGLDQTVIGSAERSRPVSPKVVYILGANEGVFPKKVSESGVFSIRERTALSEVGFKMDSSAVYACAEERLITYCALTYASERLYVSYSCSTLVGEQLQPSELVDMLRELLPGCNKITASQQPTLEGVGSAESAFELAASLYGVNSCLSASLRAYFSDKPDYEAKLASLDRAGSHEPFMLRDSKMAERLFGKNMFLSPTKIETYHKCPFMYFCRYGLGVKPRRTAELDAQSTGLLIHYVLEKLLEKYQGIELSVIDGPTAKKEIHEITDEYVEKFMGGAQDMPLRLRYNVLAAEETAADIVARLSAEAGKCSFITRDVELKIGGADAPVKAYTVDCADGCEVSVTGSIDRVDVMASHGASYVRVIDYKTGGKEFALSDVFAGLNMQMLIYLMCICENGTDRYGETVPAGVLYVPAKTGSFIEERRVTPEQSELQRIKNGRMNGLILESKEVILGMEADGRGLFINAGVNSDGSLTGTLISLEEFGELHELIDKILADMSISLRKGEIDAVPVKGKNYKNVCEYCDYRTACGHDETGVVYEIAAMKNEDAIKKLGGGGSDE